MMDVLILFFLGPLLLSLAWWAVIRLWQGRVDPSVAVPWVSSERAQAYNAWLMPRVLASSLLFLAAGLASQSAPGRPAWRIATVVLVLGVVVLTFAVVIYLTGWPKSCLPPLCRDFPGVVRLRRRERRLKRGQRELDVHRRRVRPMRGGRPAGRHR